MQHGRGGGHEQPCCTDGCVRAHWHVGWCRGVSQGMPAPIACRTALPAKLSTSPWTACGRVKLAMILSHQQVHACRTGFYMFYACFCLTHTPSEHMSTVMCWTLFISCCWDPAFCCLLITDSGALLNASSALCPLGHLQCLNQLQLMDVSRDTGTWVRNTHWAHSASLPKLSQHHSQLSWTSWWYLCISTGMDPKGERSWDFGSWEPKAHSVPQWDVTLLSLGLLVPPFPTQRGCPTSPLIVSRDISFYCFIISIIMLRNTEISIFKLFW